MEMLFYEHIVLIKLLFILYIIMFKTFKLYYVGMNVKSLPFIPNIWALIS